MHEGNDGLAAFVFDLMEANEFQDLWDPGAPLCGPSRFSIRVYRRRCCRDEDGGGARFLVVDVHVALGVNCVIRVAWPVTTSNSLRNVYFIRPISLFALTPWFAQVPDQSFIAEFARGQAVAKSLKARFDL